MPFIYTLILNEVKVLWLGFSVMKILNHLYKQRGQGQVKQMIPEFSYKICFTRKTTEFATY